MVLTFKELRNFVFTDQHLQKVYLFQHPKIKSLLDFLPRILSSQLPSPILCPVQFLLPIARGFLTLPNLFTPFLY